MREHTPVLLNEVTAFLNPGPGKKYIDATLGRGGHTNGLLKAGATVLGIDADPSVILRYSDVSSVALAKGEGSRDSSAITPQNDNLRVVGGSFSEIGNIAEQSQFSQVDGILFDLGLGSHQLDDEQRGFSFQREGPLDMRFDQHSEKTAAELINFSPEKDLVGIFYRYGEEKRFGKKIARSIMMRRKEGSIKTTTELFEIIKHSLPAQLRFRAGDTARKIFQALRIEVNDELGSLEKGLQQALLLLGTGGRLVVISFHSLEDRIVKQFFVKESLNCICPPSFPVCVCFARASLRILTKKPITASAEEIAANPRAASGKLRAAERI